MADHGDEDEHARQRVDTEREADAEAVNEAVDRQGSRAEGADPPVRACLVGVVAVVQHEASLEEEEHQEPRGDERRDPAGVVDALDRLWEHVEECDAHDDAPAEREDRLQMRPEAKCEEAAQHGRQHRAERERDRDPAHAQFSQTP